jgi:hypothetical protein
MPTYPILLSGPPEKQLIVTRTHKIVGSYKSIHLLLHFYMQCSLFKLQVQIFSYQCSQLSTPESVIEVFNTAYEFQKKHDSSLFVAVVVLVWQRTHLTSLSKLCTLCWRMALKEQTVTFLIKYVQNAHLASFSICTLLCYRLLLGTRELVSLAYQTGLWTLLR